jgi:short-subunit dehydrogenase
MNKLIVVTGGTKGIGKSIITVFASNNFDVITCARSENDLMGLKDEFKKSQPGISLKTFKADLSLKEETTQFADFIRSNKTVPDVLVNNTGVFYPGQIHNEDEGILEKSMETNLYSAYRISRALLGGMMARKSGYIFNMCSVASIEPYPGGASYCMSKFALLGMTKVLREELKDFGVKVTAVIPGSTLTSSWEGVDIPEEDFMKAEDVAKVIYSAYSLSGNTVIEEIVMRPQKGDV